MWLGAILGFILGVLITQSFPAGLLLAFVGGFVGYMASNSRTRAANKKGSDWSTRQSTTGTSRSESSDILTLQQEMRDVQRRLTEMERQLSGQVSTSPTPDQTDAHAADEAQKPTRPEIAIPAAAKTIGPVAKTVQAAPKPAEPPAASKQAAGYDPYDKVPEPAKAPVAPKPPARPRPPVRPRAPEPPALPPFVNQFIQRWVIGGNPLVKVGVLILFLGLGFLLRYAAELGWLSLELRYAGVAAMGIGLLSFGWRWRARADSYGLTMQGAGIGILYLTTLAAMKLHPLLPTALGFTILVVVAAMAAFLAVMQNALILAVVAALCGFAAPVLASTGSGNHIALFSYLTVLNLAIVAIAWFKSWRALNLIGYVCSFGLGSTWAAKYYRDDLFSTTEPFLLLLFALYVLITFLFARRTLADAPDNSSSTLAVQVREASKQVKYVDGTLAFGVPISVFWIQSLLVEPFQYGAAISAVGFGLFYFLLAFLLINRTEKRYFLLTETLIALAVVFCTLAIPLLEQPWTAAAWGAEAAGVYWIGCRQQQVHARFFALLLLLGSAFYFLPELGWSPGGTVLDGSVLSSALLTAGTGFTYWLMWRAEPGQLHRYEIQLRPFVAGFGAFFLATIPLLLFSRDWASPALAALGGGLIYASIRMSDRPLRYSGWIYQLIGGVLFLTTLHTGPGASVLANGWAGLFATSLIGAAMLLGVWIIAPNLLTGAADEESDAPLELDVPASVALMAGLAFINLAPMFVLSWRYSAMIWPLIGIVTLLWAIRTRHLGVILFSLGLQVVAGIAHLYSRSFSDIGAPLTNDVTPFLNSGFLGPVIIALAAWTCARFVHRNARTGAFDIEMGWTALGWGGLWWAFAWVSEINSVAPESGVTACLVAVTLATAWVWSDLSKRLHWPQLGLAAVAYLPVLVLLAIGENLGDNLHPLASWGALAWPAALLIHGLLLRRQPGRLTPQLLNQAHIVGAWLFLVQASLEVRWWLTQWGDADSAWPLIGWMLVPVIYLWALTRPKIQSLWPVRDHLEAYALTSAFPVIIYLLGWVWATNAFSNGSATPLPYIPLLNPLEIGYVAALFSVIVWWRSFGKKESLRDFKPAAIVVLGGSAFAAITGGVIRACHHWAQIPWRTDVLMSSYVVQTSLSIVWGVLAISLMLLGNRRRTRTIWITGASLVAVVVAKLFLVELSASGSLERIVSFIVVGLLLLFVGYVAPLPPRNASEDLTR